MHRTSSRFVYELCRELEIPVRFVAVDPKPRDFNPEIGHTTSHGAW